MEDTVSPHCTENGDATLQNGSSVGTRKKIVLRSTEQYITNSDK